MRIFFHLIFTAYLFLSAGCVIIPETHRTLVQDSSVCSIITETHCESIQLASKYLTIAGYENGLDPERITLLNWNSHKGSDSLWLQELQRMMPLVDLLTLQEGALTPELRNQLSKDYAGGWSLASAFTLSDTHTGVLTASTVSPDFSCSFRVAEPIIVIPKTVLITRYPIAHTTQSLLLVNVHMVNFALNTTSYREQLAKVFDLIKEHSGPLIIAGDFNSWSEGRQVIIRNFAETLGIEPVQFSEDHRTVFWGHILDQVFFRGLEPTEAVAQPVTVSDHNPMRVTFRLIGNRNAWSVLYE